jgi:cysteinyl-tRNA synthetase, unknown class
MVVHLFLLIIPLECISAAEVTPSASIDSSLSMSWLYQLQNAEPDKIINSGFSIAVLDYSRDGTEEKRYKKSEISKMKAASIIPLCYLSIGEAEEYRYYWRPEWKTRPEWLGKENPDWEGNYKVKYWHSKWQAVILSYVDKIIEQGFSGIYLDIVDGFEYWSDEDNPEHCLSEKEAAEQMIAFIKRLANHARKKTGDNFIVIPQNGERLLYYDHDGSYLGIISGQGVEDLWFDGTKPQPKSEIAERIYFLKSVIQRNKVVLAVEYVDDGSGYIGANKNRIDDVIFNCVRHGFHCYIAHSTRELKTLNRIQNIQP